MSSGRVTRLTLRALDAMLPAPRIPASAVLGSRGEEEAYFFLRKEGYTIIARNWRTPRRRGELDLVGWDDGVLAFIEIKSRSERGFAPAEAAVDHEKQNELRGMAREFLRRVPGRPSVRFDIVSIYLGKDARAPLITLFKNAFTLS
jgi:putative endonuclease